jgi:hypothetical protein
MKATSSYQYMLKNTELMQSREDDKYSSTEMAQLQQKNHKDS